MELINSSFFFGIISIYYFGESAKIVCNAVGGKGKSKGMGMGMGNSNTVFWRYFSCL